VTRDVERRAATTRAGTSTRIAARRRRQPDGGVPSAEKPRRGPGGLAYQVGCREVGSSSTA
jgi:hypothetical protein